MIPGFSITSFIEFVGVIGVMAVIFAESGLLIGFFLPGDSLLFTAGFLVFTGMIHIDITLLVVLVFISAVLGDSVGYLFGSRVGRQLFNRQNSRLFRQENLRRAETFYEKYGPKAIVFARFIPIVRTFAPIVAGTGNMKYKTFLTYNLIGGLLWTASITYIGFFAGKWFEHLGLGIDTVILPIILIIIFISILPPLIHLLANKEQRQAFWTGTKREIILLFTRKK